MSGPPRNPDQLNTIGIVVVGVCGAVLVYVSIVALQAFYMNDTQQLQTTADFGGQQTAFQSIKAAQLANIADEGLKEDPKLEATIADLESQLQKDPSNADLRAKDEAAKAQRRYHEPIEQAMAQVIATADQSQMIPGMPSTVSSIAPIFGRPPIGVAPAAGSGAGSAAPAAPPGAGSGSATAPTSGSGAGSAEAGSGAGSAAAPVPAAGSGSAAAAPIPAATPAVPPHPATAPLRRPSPVNPPGNPPVHDTRPAPPVPTGGPAANGVGAPPAGSINGTATGSAASPPPNAP